MNNFLKFFLAAFFLLAAFLSPLYFRWLSYFFSLATHQLYVFTHQQALDKFSAQTTTTQKQKDAIALIEKVKEFGKKTFLLSQSKSYGKIVDLKRDSLGYNITVAPEFSLQPVEFSFPPIGSFSYLGFFSRDKALTWQKYYSEKNYDVHLSEIGAYSTLGILRDPIFSTYLSFSKGNLIDLILHEMTHEKIFFKNSVLISEVIAVYSARQASKLFLQQHENDNKNFLQQHRQASQKIFLEYNVFYALIDEYKEKLHELYAQDIPAPQKREKKKEIFAELHKNLEEKNKSFKYVTWAKALLQEPLNNATLAQIKRYSPHSIDLLDNIFEDECQKNFVCFFEKLETLKKCDKVFLEKEIFIPQKTYQEIKPCAE